MFGPISPLTGKLAARHALGTPPRYAMTAKGLHTHNKLSARRDGASRRVLRRRVVTKRNNRAATLCIRAVQLVHSCGELTRAGVEMGRWRSVEPVFSVGLFSVGHISPLGHISTQLRGKRLRPSFTQVLYAVPTTRAYRGWCFRWLYR